MGLGGSPSTKPGWRFLSSKGIVWLLQGTLVVCQGAVRLACNSTCSAEKRRGLTFVHW